MKRKFYLLPTLLCLCLSLFAQSENWKLFQSMESCNDLLEVGDDIWFANEFGITRVNKATQERTFYTMHNSNLPSEDVQAIAQDADGNIWIGTYDIIIAMWDGSEWTNFTSVPFPEDLQVENPFEEKLYSMEFDQDNNMWVGTHDGLSMFDGTDWSHYNKNNTNEPLLDFIWDIAIDHDGNIYVVNDNVYQFDGENWTNYTEMYPDMITYNDAELYTDSNGAIWFSNMLTEIAKKVGDEWISYNESQSPGLPFGIKFFEYGGENPGMLSFGDNYYTLEDELWQLQTPLEFDAVHGNNELYHIDTEGNRWLVREGTIVVNYFNEVSRMPLSEFPMYENTPVTLVESPTGQVYFITDFGHISRYDADEGMTEFFPGENPDAGLNTFYGGMGFSNNGEMWIGYAPGVVHFDGDNWTNYSTYNSDIGMDYLSKIVITSTNKMWAAGDEGLSSFDGVSWDHYNTSNSILEFDRLNNIVVDDNDVIWTTTTDYDVVNSDVSFELYQIDGTDWTMHNHTNSILPDQAYVTDLFVDENNLLWLATAYNGVYTYDGNEWTNVLELNDLLSGVNSIAGHDGKIYLAHGDQGIIIYENGILSYLNTSNSGLLNDFVHDLLMDQEGNLWISVANKGMQVYNQNGFTSNLNTVEPSDNTQISLIPNPANEETRMILKSESATTNNQLRIFDVQGLTIQRQSIGSLSAGEHQLPISASSLSSGVYFVEIKNNEFSRTLKLLVKN